MIYKISNRDAYPAVESAKIICWSADGSMLLLEADSMDPEIVVEEYETLGSLLSEPFWRQPCIACDV
jgi:hypothetical protein